MIKKNISFDKYLQFFYELLRVNTPSHDRSDTGQINSSIFYKLDNSNIIISFSDGNFYIEVTKSLVELQDEYDRIFEDYLDNKPNFIQWLNDKYMDSRGINEQ